MSINRKYWIIWLLLTLAGSGWLVMNLKADDQSLYLPGQTSHGHYQIEMACNACHGDGFEGEAGMQKACMNCHAAELKQADDSHPRSKFTNPRNADRVAKLDARLCVTCHAEHKPEISGVMGVTVPEDTCYLCHADIEEDRPSHAGMAFDTCASAGCHNFHDNRGLYENFLAKHLDEKATLKHPVMPSISPASAYTDQAGYPLQSYPIKPLVTHSIDLPGKSPDIQFMQDWLATSHAKAGVNCSACHQLEGQWQVKPAEVVCQQCHQTQSDGFRAGRHGMRLAQNLSPMTPAQARQPMQEKAHDKELQCHSCHRAHEYNTDFAAMESCLGCHNDEHSLNYKKSAHYRLWLESTTGMRSKEAGVSCATCHLPRTQSETGNKRIFVQHNQNDNLRPNEKMLRSVCMHCHGLGFAIDALADAELVKNNFAGQPSVQIQSLEMTRQRLKKKD